MLIVRTIFAAAALMLSGAAAAQAETVPQPPLAAAPDYSKDETWLCLPGRSDICSRPLGTAALNANGYGSVGQVVPAQNPPADCFYIYPTISLDPGLNSDLVAGAEEQAAAMSQFARFGTVCRTFAPIYRQVTLRSIPLAFSGQNMQANFDIAYADVLAAWRDFLARRNRNLPFVIIGHSQGSIHGVRLIQQEIEGKPVAGRMLSAILLGWPVEVPEGKLVGGTFKSTPLCTKDGQTGCVLTWMSFRSERPPPSPSFLGRASRPGMTAGCTNPAALGSDKPAKLDSYWFAAAPARPGVEPIAWSNQGPPPTPFLRTEGLVTGACRHQGQAGYLAITVDADPSDARTDRIPGDVYLMGRVNPGWGLHLADMNLAQGDLIRLVEAQAQAFSARVVPAGRSSPKRPPTRRR